MVDIGNYNANPDLYRKLIEELYANHPPVTLPPEYAYFVEENLLRFFIRLARYKFVARLLRKTDRVLEIGSGSGLGSVFLGQHCAHVTGLELKQTELAEARVLNRRDNVEFAAGDFFEMDSSIRYDAIVALDVIEHMDMESGRRLLEGIAAHLDGSGMAVLGTPSLYSYEYQSELSKASHVKCYDQAELVQLVETAFGRAVPFSMNDEVVHTGFPKMAWYYFVLAFAPKPSP